LAPHYGLRDLARVQHVLAVLARHGFSQVIAASPLGRIPGLGGLPADGGEGGGVSTPRRLIAAFTELGPTFVKLGQMLSTRPDLLPEDWVAEFTTLQDRVPPFPVEEARRLVEEELGAPLDEVFASFGREPVASASIAQVHRATLPDGRAVAVKIQRPGIERTLRSDLNILYVLADFLERGDGGLLQRPRAVVEAFDRGLAEELDFLHEAGNADLLGDAFQGLSHVRAPRVHRPLTTRRVLVLDWAPGRKLCNLREGPVSPDHVMDQLIEATYRQIFVRGVFHADPHPGNLVVSDEGVLTYLDFGLVGRVSGEMREVLVGILTGIVFLDGELLARTLYRAGSAEGRVQVRDLAAEIQGMLDAASGKSLSRLDAGRLALDILALARRHGLRLPPEYSLLARAQLTLDGVARDLAPDWDIIARVRPWAERLLRERIDPGALPQELMRGSLSAAAALRSLPGQLDQVFLDLERGAFQLRAETPAVDRLTETLDRLGRALVFGVGVSAYLVSAAVLGAALLLRPTDGEAFPLLGTGAVVTSLLAASLLVAALTWNLFLRGKVGGWGRGLLAGLLRREEPPTEGRPARPEGAAGQARRT
jgi:ubiquinone biosynthesis protein